MKFHSKSIEEHAEAPLADEGRLEELVAHWTQRETRPANARASGNACYVISVHRPEETAASAAQLREITGLVEAQGDRVVGACTHRLVRPDARTLIRSGSASRIAADARACGADMLVVDAGLTASQTRNLEDATGLPICDREAVILNVFQRHATTRRARVQVELAHLEYLRPRIRGIGLNMDQQIGGVPGGRGPGEMASELLARQLDDRLARLRHALAQLNRAGVAQRKRRSACARVVLVGYTNAGKTSLMNALTSAELSVRDRPFETLDTTSRSLTRHAGDVVLSDTVGFIRRLPERLLASFESTLAEVSEASLLLLVVDASDPELDAHLATTQAMLERLGAAEVPRLVVFNKVDRLDAPLDRSGLALASTGQPWVALSTRDVHAIEALRQRVLATVRARHRVKEVFVPYARHEITADIYRRCRVLHSIAVERGTQLVIEGEPYIVDEIAASIRSMRR